LRLEQVGDPLEHFRDLVVSGLPCLGVHDRISARRCSLTALVEIASFAPVLLLECPRPNKQRTAQPLHEAGKRLVSRHLDAAGEKSRIPHFEGRVRGAGGSAAISRGA
jgi:hypothetical protein